MGGGGLHTVNPHSQTVGLKECNDVVGTPLAVIQEDALVTL